MGPIYQRFFVKRYIQETITKHPQMEHWEKIGLIDMQKVRKSINLSDYHDCITAKILGLKSSK